MTLTTAQKTRLDKCNPNTLADELREIGDGFGQALGQMEGSVPFDSTEQTGTGNEQSIAHGRGAVPTAVRIFPSSLIDEYGDAIPMVYTLGTHTSTHCKVTMTAGVKYYVHATFVPAS